MRKFYKKTILWFFTAIMPLKGPFFFSLFIFGIGLLFLNLIGVSTTLRNPDIMQEPLKDKFDLEFSLERFNAELDLLSKNKNLNDSNKIVQATYLVNRSMAHYWHSNQESNYNVEIPAHENYLLFLLARIYPKKYLKYEFCNWKRAIERGVGLCSQHVIVEMGVLNRLGIKNRVVGLSGHIVLTAEYQPNKWLVADPDYGVVVPVSIDLIQKNTAIIGDYYKRTGYNSNHTAFLIGVYGIEGNYVADTYCGNGALFEDVLYFLIWIIPMLFMVPLYCIFRSNGHF
jgi:hypothetical protein